MIDAEGFHWSLNGELVVGTDSSHWGFFNGSWSAEENLVPGVIPSFPAILLHPEDIITLAGYVECLKSIRECVRGFSFLIWFKFDSKSTYFILGSNMVLDQSGNGRGFEVSVNESRLLYEVRFEDKSWTLQTQVAADMWNHVVASWSPLTGIIFYLNGIHMNDIKAKLTVSYDNR